MKKELVAYTGNRFTLEWYFDERGKSFVLEIYAFKASTNRFLCFFFDGDKVIITNAYTKKSSKMPAKEKARAVNAKRSYTKRCKEESYYE